MSPSVVVYRRERAFFQMMLGKIYQQLDKPALAEIAFLEAVNQHSELVDGSETSPDAEDRLKQSRDALQSLRDVKATK